MDVTAAVLEAVGEAAGVDPMKLPPLHASIDPGALERCVDSTGDAAVVQFTYSSYTVAVRGDETVAVEPVDGDPSPPEIPA